jgi:hypothetical protein
MYHDAMYRDLTIGSWVTLGADCPLSCQVPDGEDHVIIFVCGSSSQDFELAMETGALRTFVRLGTEALAELDSRQPR